jgi:Fe-S-cluster containining protein
MTDQKPQIPIQRKVSPEALEGATEIRFHCFNACCKNAAVTLAPYDIVRLKRRLGMSSTDFLPKHAVPFQMDADGMPGVKLKTKDEGACLLLDGDEGCSVYSDRPTVCRYYPVNLIALWEKDASEAKQRYSLVREEHCMGHEEDRTISIADYSAEQGCESYDELNREWYELILKKKPTGPTVGRPPLQSL